MRPLLARVLQGSVLTYSCQGFLAHAYVQGNPDLQVCWESLAYLLQQRSGLLHKASARQGARRRAARRKHLLLDSLPWCRYSAILRDMLHQIEEFNRKNGRGSGGGGLGGGLAGLAVGALMGAVTGHGLGGAISGAMSALSGGSIGGQTPQLSASDPVDLDMQLQI